MLLHKAWTVRLPAFYVPDADPVVLERPRTRYPFECRQDPPSNSLRWNGDVHGFCVLCQGLQRFGKCLRADPAEIRRHLKHALEQPTLEETRSMPGDHKSGRPADDPQIEGLRRRLIGAPIWTFFSEREVEIWSAAAVKYFKAQAAANLPLESAYMRVRAMIAAGAAMGEEPRECACQSVYTVVDPGDAGDPPKER